MSIRYIGLGASGEIGDSAHYLDIEGTSVLLDAGVHPRYDGLESLPDYERIRDVDLEAILVSHCHLDHLGSLPVALSYFPYARVFMSDAGAALAPVMLSHTVKVMERLRVEAGIDEYPLYTLDDIDAMSYVFQGMRTDRTFPIYSTLRGGTDLEARLYDAGHILGAAGVWLRGNGQTIFYTSDTCAHDQEIIPGAVYPDQVDILICECTLAADEKAEHLTRESEIRRFASSINSVLDKDGCVLIPAFSLGRTQEMLTLLHQLRASGEIRGVEIYSAGFGSKISSIYDRTSERSRRHEGDTWLAHLDIQRVPHGDVTKGRYLKEPSIVLVSSGMMAEHTMSFKLAEKMLPYDHHGIFFVGYCDPRMPGHKVASAEKGQVVRMTEEGRSIPVACDIDRFHFSAHSNRQELLALVKQLKPSTLVLVHGDRSAADWMESEVLAWDPTMRILQPERGEEIELA
jgi:Cft2 family RNA processing exonuclease